VKGIDFSEQMTHVSSYLSNLINFGPSVRNVGTFLEEIRYFFLDEFACTASINHLFEEEDWVHIEKSRGEDVFKIKIKRTKHSVLAEEYTLSRTEMLYLFTQGYISALEFADRPGSEQSFDEGDDAFRSHLVAHPLLSKYFFVGMMSKTLCDLSISSYCAANNYDPTNTEKYYIFLTFDRLAACISTMLYGMKPLTFLQREKSLFVPVEGNLVFSNDSLTGTESFHKNCLMQGIS
jgi:hypothetical protein